MGVIRSMLGRAISSLLLLLLVLCALRFLPRGLGLLFLLLLWLCRLRFFFLLLLPKGGTGAPQDQKQNRRTN